MNFDLTQAMRRAAAATRAGDPLEASRIIRDALTGGPGEGGAAGQKPSPGASDELPPRKRWPLGDVLRTLRGAQATSPILKSPAAAPEPAPPPAGAQFVTRSYAGQGGARNYKLYIPTAAPRVRGLIVMLHGCKQNPDDFAVGTDMNAVAETHGLLVAYPAQTRSANASNCWNWFNPGDQRRDAGEPAIIAGIAREIAAEYKLDRRRIFVAGLSAGGAMAAVLGETYPDLFAAVGVHSGLPYGAANDVMSAFAAMKGDAPVSRRTRATGPRVRTIIFHGDQDRTVHPVNAERVVEAAIARAGVEPAGLEKESVERGRRRTATVYAGPDGVPLVEQWRIEGAGHAWSGGNPKGSFTDAAGPDASREMARFFLAGAG
jgi:poly(hydroxyalkanoate) depolymerase family esterase